LAENCAERGTPDHDVRIIEAGGVGEVDEFPAELYIHAFTYLEILEYGCVEVVDSIAAQPRIITWRVAGDLISRIGEGTGISKKAFAINLFIAIIPSASNELTGKRMRTNNEGTCQPSFCL
jgi:hypothetical protein